MTFLEAINAVLRRLREDAVVSSNSTDYSKLIGDFVNQALYDVEYAYDWSFLRTEYEITTAANTHNYDLPTTDIKILSVFNQTKEWFLQHVTTTYYAAQWYSSSKQTDSPTQYAIHGQWNDVPQIQLYPVPASVEKLIMHYQKHTDSYALDGTDDSNAINYLYSHALILKAYALAVSERGEDGGIGYSEADERARLALSDAIAMDSTKHPLCENSWQAV